jgi:NADH:ubiquinone oxidoreductase subunit E
MSASILQENKEKFAELQNTIDEFKDQEGPLMPILHKAKRSGNC